jgi:hypothetical protein
MPMSPRRGVCVHLTLDHDALSILQTLAPGVKHYGQLLSELLRLEVDRRLERQKILQELRDQQEVALVG